ncbi:uncharacterized protein LOC144108474 [Amblyomma americanum]
MDSAGQTGEPSLKSPKRTGSSATKRFVAGSSEMSPRKKAKTRLSRPTKARSPTAVDREPTTGAWKEASPSPVLPDAAAEASKSSGSGLGHGSTSGQALVPTSAPVAEHPAAEQSPRKTHAALFKGTTTPGSNILRTIVRGPAKSEHSKKEHKAPSPAKNSAPSSPPEAPSVRPAPTPSSTLRAFEGVVSFFALRSKGTSHVPTPQAEPAAKDEDLSVCLLPDEEVKEAQALWQTTCKLQEMMGPAAQTSPHGWQFYLKAHGAWLAFIVGAGLFVAFMLALSMFARYRNAIVTAQKICRTEDCVIHERLLRQNINGSVDPCQDFSAYACSAWSPSKQFVSYAAATTSDAIEAWFKARA